MNAAVPPTARFRLHTRASLALDQAPAWLDALLAHFAGHDLRMQRDAAGGLLDYGVGQTRLAWDGAALHCHLQAEDAVSLQAMQQALAAHLLEFGQIDGAALRWDGDGAAATASPFRWMQVVGVEAVTPWLRRVQLRGQDLARFAQDAHLHCKLYFPAPGQVLDVDDLPAPATLTMRTYTLRAVDAAAGTVAVDFVLHADAGPGSAWALQASPGQWLGLSGPGGRTVRAADWMLLAGDETAVPALARVLPTLPPATRGAVFIEVDGPQDELPLAHPPGLALHWLHRGGEHHGNHGSSDALLRAVQAQAWPDGMDPAQVFVWAGCEFDTAQALRQWVRDDRGLDKGQHLIVAYWRRGMSETELKHVRG